MLSYCKIALFVHNHFLLSIQTIETKRHTKPETHRPIYVNSSEEIERPDRQRGFSEEQLLEVGLLIKLLLIITYLLGPIPLSLSLRRKCTSKNFSEGDKCILITQVQETTPSSHFVFITELTLVHLDLAVAMSLLDYVQVSYIDCPP